MGPARLCAALVVPPAGAADPNGLGVVTVGASGYADDTQAVATETAALQRTAPTMETWLTVTGYDVRVDKSSSWSRGEGGAWAVLLCSLPIRAAGCFRRWGVDVAVGGARSAGPNLAWRLESGRTVLRRLPHLPTFQQRGRAVSTLVTPVALHGVAVAPLTDRDLMGLETMVLRPVWGATRLSAPRKWSSPVRPDCAHPKTITLTGASHPGERLPAPDDGSFRTCLACGPSSHQRAGGHGQCGTERSHCTWCRSPCGRFNTRCRMDGLRCHALRGGPPPPSDL